MIFRLFAYHVGLTRGGSTTGKDMEAMNHYKLYIKDGRCLVIEAASHEIAIRIAVRTTNIKSSDVEGWALCYSDGRTI